MSDQIFNHEEDDAQQDEPVVDAAPEEGEAEHKNRMAWEGVEDASFGVQFANIEMVVRITNRMFEAMESLIKHGVPEELGATSVRFTPMEAVALSLGLNLVGFFVPELREQASNLLRRAVEAAKESERNYTDEEREVIKIATSELRDEVLAKMLGYDTVEEYIADRDAQQEEKQSEADSAVFPHGLSMN